LKNFEPGPGFKNFGTREESESENAAPATSDIRGRQVQIFSVLTLRQCFPALGLGLK